MSIEIANIKKSFGRTQVLNDISLDIPSGQMVALLGPSGSGKPRCCVLSPGWSIRPAVISVSTAPT
jgi:ABC-type polar amino acid transport system ATPase subunit